MLKTENDILTLIEKDAYLMELLKAVKQLDLPDWWISAGVIRSKIWDTLHGYKSWTPVEDIDVVYYDPVKTDEAREKAFEEKLQKIKRGVPWSVKNQARMHDVNGVPPYTSAVDGISKFPETVTALGVRLDQKDHLQLAAPWGVADVLNMEVNPTPAYTKSETLFKVYENRIRKKHWETKWPKVKINKPSVL